MSAKKGLLIFIIALGFVLRVWGVGFGLPDLYHADEPIVVNHALAYGSGDFNPHFFNIPPLVSYLLFFCYGIFFVVGRACSFFQDLQAFQTYFFAHPESFYLLARIIFGTMLGTLSLGLFYRILSRHFSDKLALIATLFFSVCFLHVRDSHYIYADIPLLVVMLIFFEALFQLYDQPNALKYHIRMGAIIGLAAAVKYNGFFLAIPYLLCFLRKKRPAIYDAPLAGIITVFVFFILNPYALLDAPVFFRELLEQNRSQSGAGWTHHFLYSLHGAGEWPLLYASIAGIGFSIRKFSIKRFSLMVFYLAYYVVLVFKGQPYDRYVLPLLIPMIFFAAYFVVHAGDLMNSKRRSLTLCVLSLLIALPSLTKCIQWNSLMSTPDNRTLSKSWIEKNIPAGKRIALGWDFYMPRLKFSPRQLADKLAEVKNDGTFSKAQQKRLEFLMSPESSSLLSYNLYFFSRDAQTSASRFLFSKPTIPYDIDTLKKERLDYVILGSFSPSPDSRLEKFHAALRAQAQKIAVFSPYKDGRMNPIDEQPLTGGPFLWEDVMSRERNGQPLEIYKLNT